MSLEFEAIEPRTEFGRVRDYVQGGLSLLIDSKTPLERVAQGDSKGVDACLQRYGGLIWTLARRLCRTREDAEDATQDIFVELWRYAGRFDPTLSTDVNFVAMIARRRLVDRARREARRVSTAPLADEIAVSLPRSNLDQLELSEDAARARACLNALDENERRVIELSVDKGLSQSAIADQEQMPLGTVKTHTRRGFLKLRKMLGLKTSVIEGTEPQTKGGRP